VCHGVCPPAPQRENFSRGKPVEAVAMLGFAALTPTYGFFPKRKPVGAAWAAIPYPALRRSSMEDFSTHDFFIGRIHARL